MSESLVAPRRSGQKASSVATVVSALMAIMLFSASALGEPIFETVREEDKEKGFDLDFSLKEPVSINDYGVGGILDIPSARMFEEGMGTFTYSRKDVQDIYALGYQLTPRLEMSFRYGIPDPRFGGGRSGGIAAEYADRSIEARYRVIEETGLLPSLVIGVRDIGGAQEDGGAEYLVASKLFNNLDLTLGIGWGALSQRSVAPNPLRVLWSGSSVRENLTLGAGGKFRTTEFFRGQSVGLFGGLRYSISPRLKILMAYNSDAYDFAVKRLGALTDTSPLGVGLEWEPYEDIKLAISRQQGRSWGFRLSASLDTAREPRRKPPNGFGADPAEIVKADDLPQERGWWPRFVYDAQHSGVSIRHAQIEDKTLTVRFQNSQYRLEADAIRRVLTLVAVYAPPAISEIVAIGEVAGLPVYSVRYTRPALDSPMAASRNNEVTIESPVEVRRRDFNTRARNPAYRINAGLNPSVYLFDPVQPLLYQVSARASFGVNFGVYWGVRGEWIQSLTTQLDQIDRGSDSLLPRVRSDSENYKREGASGIENLIIWHRGKIGPEIYYHAQGGLLEEMYAGLAAEVLWKPFDSRWAIGLSAQKVHQREFDKRFGLRDFSTETGHLSAYWATPFENFDVAIHAGRYLAGDVGYTVEIKKLLPNGWSIGGFFTRTNVPASVFGEGSFDKGLTFSAPIDFFSKANTRERSGTTLRFLNRDGGRPVEGSVRQLWDLLRDSDISQFDEFAERMSPQ